MRVVDPTRRGRCGRRTRSGGKCAQWAMYGQTVCRMHGGKSPQALAKADERMRAMVHPALDSLKRLIDKDEFPATKYVLDWAGFRPAPDAEPATESTPLQVTVIFDRNADQNPEPPTLALP